MKLILDLIELVCKIRTRIEDRRRQQYHRAAIAVEMKLLYNIRHSGSARREPCVETAKDELKAEYRRLPEKLRLEIERTHWENLEALEEVGGSVILSGERAVIYDRLTRTSESSYLQTALPFDGKD